MPPRPDRAGRATLEAVATIAAIAALAAGCASSPEPAPAPGASEAAQAAPVFRWVQVNAGVITLGEPLAPAIAAAGPGDTLVALPPGSFSGAERITVHLRPDGAVRALTFDYVLGADFAAMVADYEAQLGRARRSVESRPGEEPAEVAVWRDARTELRLVRDPNRSAWTVRARLSDLSAP